MKARLVKIGNSRGVRLPKPVIEEAGLVDEIELSVREGSIVITPATTARAGWAEAARKARERSEDEMFDESTPTRFDEKEWDW